MANPIRSILERRAPFKTAQGRRVQSLFYAFMTWTMRLGAPPTISPRATSGMDGGVMTSTQAETWYREIPPAMTCNSLALNAMLTPGCTHSPSDFSLYLEVSSATQSDE